VKALNSLLKIILILAVVLMISVFYPDVFDLDEGGSGSVSYASGFNINQSAGTSQGTVKRHIDISSPWSGGYVYEDMTIKGRVEITESFTMGTPSVGTVIFLMTISSVIKQSSLPPLPQAVILKLVQRAIPVPGRQRSLLMLLLQVPNLE